jgi:UTP--glucose-1-phosphate uridylyltransferase
MTMAVESGHLPAFLSKMKTAGLQPVVLDTFAWYYEKVLTGDKGLIFNKDIRPVASHEIANAAHFDSFVDAGKKALPHSVMIVLNGGLGTSMGLTCAKSLLEARDGKSFLEIIVLQANNRHIRLAFMNSFNTHDDTLASLKLLHQKHPPLCFLQNKFPKILQSDFSPASWPEHPDMEWNPPGHGDIYAALYTSGVLDQLLKDGVRYAFIANSDNLGATMDETLLGYFSEKELPFMMEVSQRTPVDFKGGHLAFHQDGRLILREVAQCPDNELDISRDISRYQYFNTNNIWVNLEFVKKLIKTQGTIRLPMILNPKTLNPRDDTSPAVYQIETAMGSAISLFEGATAVVVPRSRFYPVKKCNELLAIRSDCFTYSDDCGLEVNPERRLGQIQIDLDSKYYGKVDEFGKRFPYGPPSLVNCESLTVKGDVFFGNQITLTGNVAIQNFSGVPVVVPDKSVIESTISVELNSNLYGDANSNLPSK